MISILFVGGVLSIVPSLTARAIGIAIIAGLTLVATVVAYTRERVSIRGRSIRFHRQFLRWGSRGIDLDVSAILSVTVDLGRREVRVRTAQALIRTGGGLPQDALEWLRDLIKAVASAEAGHASRLSASCPGCSEGSRLP